jgi:hypothetical protein
VHEVARRLRLNLTRRLKNTVWDFLGFPTAFLERLLAPGRGFVSVTAARWFQMRNGHFRDGAATRLTVNGRTSVA